MELWNQFGTIFRKLSQPADFVTGTFTLPPPSSRAWSIWGARVERIFRAFHVELSSRENNIKSNEINNFIVEVFEPEVHEYWIFIMKRFRSLRPCKIPLANLRKIHVENSVRGWSVRPIGAGVKFSRRSHFIHVIWERFSSYRDFHIFSYLTFISCWASSL